MIRRRPALLALLILLSACAPETRHPLPENAASRIAQSPDEALIPSIVAHYAPHIALLLDDAGTYEIQILYTRIERTDRPVLRHFSYRCDPNRYFNPASLVKLPVACLALQKLRELQVPGLDRNTRLAIGSAHACQKPVRRDPTAPGVAPTIGHYIKKALIVSDNDAYNRLYEFLGQSYIHTNLQRMGYPSARIIRRFNGCSADDNRYTNPFTFYSPDNRVIYHQPMLVHFEALRNPLGAVFKGSAYLNAQGRLVHEPFNYETHNYLCLQDIHTMLQMVIFPDLFPESRRFKLYTDDYAFLRHCLSCLPGESDIPAYHNAVSHPDNHKKYFMFGDSPDGRITDRSVRSFNVVGRSDGFLSDCAYISDPSKKIEFFLSAVIYVNADRIIKDGRYEYKEIGLPFLAGLGRAFYAYEQERLASRNEGQ